MTLLNAREIMKAISDHDIEPQHIGSHSIETLRQLSNSLFNRYKPQTMTENEKTEWREELVNILGNLNDMNDSEDKENILKNIEKFIESIIFQWTLKNQKKKPNVSTKTNQDDGLMHSF